MHLSVPTASNVPSQFETWVDLAVILVLIVAPGVAAMIALAWLTGLVSSLLALLMR